MKITTTRPTSSGEGSSFTAQQPVRLERGIYGLMFARYNEPKMRPNPKDGTSDEVIGLGFVVTHAANESQLPRFSEAFKMAKTKRFWNPKQKTASTYTSFLNAILAGKYTPEQIDSLADEDLPDLDDLIGYPLQALIEPSTTARANGIFDNGIKDFFPAPTGLKKAVAVLYRGMETSYTDDGKRRYMKSPKAEYEQPGAAPSSAQADDGLDESAIPF